MDAYIVEVCTVFVLPQDCSAGAPTSTEGKGTGENRKPEESESSVLPQSHTRTSLSGIQKAIYVWI